MDGLENVCRVAVCGGLDWSPGVHEQCIGRVHRDGQQDPVMAYFLVSEEGSDPVVSGVLGIKREQIESVRNPDAGLIERLEISEHRSEEHTSELQSLMRISYAVFCLKKKNTTNKNNTVNI